MSYFKEHRQNNLQKAQKKLKRTELLYGKKEFKVKFDRKSNRKFLKFIKTRPHITVGEKTAPSTHGLVHGAVRFTQEQVIGDVPSITKKINSYKPKTFKGKAFKLAAKSVNFAVHDVGRTAVDVALASEAATLKVGKYGAKKLTGYVNQKFESALDETDTGKVLKATKTLSIAATSGAIKHFKMREKNHLEKAKFKLKKAEYKVTKKDVVKPQLKANRQSISHYKSLPYKKITDKVARYKSLSNKEIKAYQPFLEQNAKKLKVNKSELKRADSRFYKKSLKRENKLLKSERKQYNSDIKGLKKQQSSDIKSLTKSLKKEYKPEIKKLKKQYKPDIKGLKLDNKKLKTQKKFAKKNFKVQKKISKLSKQSLGGRIAKYSGKAMVASAWQKAMSADENNDALKVVNTVGTPLAKAVAKKALPSKKDRLHKAETKRNSLQQKQVKKEQKLNKQESKLKNKKKPADKKKAKNKWKKMSLAKKFIAVVDIASGGLKEAMTAFTPFLLKVIAVVIGVQLIFTIFFGIFAGGSFVLGTYPAQDYDLTEAEEYYTKLAWDMNEQILQITNGDWKDVKKALKNLGVDSDDYDDEADNKYFGYSEKFTYEPNYDYDPWKLWAFLCAFYYDFEAEDASTKFWEFNSDGEDALTELFNMEYTFEQYYDNKSYWETKSSYDYYGGKFKNSDDSFSLNYYSAEEPYKDSSSINYTYYFKPINYPSVLSEYLDSDGYLYLEWFGGEYRVVNPNNKWHKTGYVIQNQRSSLGNSYPLYTLVDSSYVMELNGENYARDSRKFDGWDEAWFMITPTNSSQLFGNSNWYYNVVKKYYWKNDCTLYYNVNQNMSFDECIRTYLQSMTYGDKRIEYYNMFLGVGDEETTEDNEPTYGLHQMLNSLTGTSITESTILNGYGYDVQAWNQKHCSIDDIHEGVDIAMSTSAALCAPFDCEIEYYNKEAATIVLRQNDVHFWYEVEKGESGITRDMEVIITNVHLLDSLDEEDTLEAGESFATLQPEKLCSKNFINIVKKMSIDTYDNNMSDLLIHVMVKIDTDGVGWDYIDPRLVFY